MPSTSVSARAHSSSTSCRAFGGGSVVLGSAQSSGRRQSRAHVRLEVEDGVQLIIRHESQYRFLPTGVYAPVLGARQPRDPRSCGAATGKPCGGATVTHAGGVLFDAKRRGAHMACATHWLRALVRT